jgi:hypothetical protein
VTETVIISPLGAPGIIQGNLPPSAMRSHAAFQAAIDDLAAAGKEAKIPRGTWPLGYLAAPEEIDISGLGALSFAPGAEILSDNPSRGVFLANGNTGLRIEGLRARYEFDDGNIFRPDIAWQQGLNAAGTVVTTPNEEMLAWLTAWNDAFGTSLNVDPASILNFKQRWDLVYTGTPFESLAQISPAGRPSGLILNNCSELKIYDPFVQSCVAQINDQGGAATGDALYDFATYIDTLKMGTDERFALLGKKGVAVRVDRLVCDVTGTRDTGGAPHGIYFSGNPDTTPTPEANTVASIGVVQVTTYNLAPVVKAREASIDIGAILGKTTQSLLGLVHCTGSIGPVTSLDQTLSDVDNTGSKFVANFTRCYDMRVARMNVQQRPSTGPAPQNALRVADVNGCERMTFEGFDVVTTRLDDAGGMVRFSLSTDCDVGPGSLTNLGNTPAYLYELSVGGEIGGSNGGSNGGNSFDVVRCSANARIADIGGASRNTRFNVDVRLLADGFEEGVTIRDDSFGASNTVNMVFGERIVPFGATPPSFETRAYDSLLLRYTQDEDKDDDIVLNYSNGDTVTLVGPSGTVTVTAVTALSANGQFLIGAEPSDSQKNLAALVNLDTPAAGRYQAVAANPDYSGVASGREFVAVNRVTGAAGNGYAMSTTSLRAFWTSGFTVNGGLVDGSLFNSVLAFEPGATDVTLDLPDPSILPIGSRLAVSKSDDAAGFVTTDTHLGATVSVLRKEDDRIDLYSDGTGWQTFTASTPHVAMRGDTSERLSITDYADDPTSGDWTDIFESAMAAGYRNIYADDRAFQFTNLIPADGTRLEFGPNHTIGNAAPRTTSNIIVIDGAQNVSIVRPFFDLPPMLEANTGKMANVYCNVSAGGIANPVVISEGGSGYTPSSGTFDYSLGAGDLGTGGVIRFTTVGGVITAGEVITAGTGYVASSSSRMLVGRSQYASYSIYVGGDDGDYSQNILIEGARQQYGRGFLRVNGANNVTARDCLLEDGGSSYVGMTFEKVTNFKALQNRIYRGHGSGLINGCAIRVSGDEPSIIQTGLIAHNIVEDILIGNGIDSNLCNVRDVSILGNIVTMRDPLTVYAYQLKQGLTSTLTDLNERGAKNYIWRDNQAILYHPAAGGWDLQNNIDGEAFEPWLDRTNIIDFRGCSDTTSSYAVRGTGVTGGFIGPTIVECQTGIRLTGGTPGYNRNVIVAPLIRRCRYGVWIDDVGRTVGVRDADIVASDIGVYVSETGTSDFRIEDTKVRIRGRRLNSLTINTAGTGYTDGTYAVYANGGGGGLIFEVTATAGALTSAQLTGGGFGYLGGASGAFKLTIDPPNNWTGGTGGIVECTVTSGIVTAVAVSTAGSGYLASGNGVWAPEFGYGFEGTITVSGGVCTASSVTNGGIGFTSNPTLAIGNLTLPSGIGAGSGTIALTGAVSSSTGYATRLIDVQSAKISGNWFESINSNVRLENGTGALSCKNVQVTNNTLVSSAEHISLETTNNQYTALHNTRIGPASSDSTTTVASGAIRATGNVIKLAPEGGVADSLDTINGALGFGHTVLLVGSATAPITVTAAGNIRPLAGGTRTLADQYASLELRWNGSLWCEYGFTDVVAPDVGLLTATWATLPSAATYPGRCVLITDVGVDGGSVWVSNGSIWAPTGPVVLARSAVQSAAHTGTVTETTVQSVTIPAGLMGTNRSIRVSHTWSVAALSVNANAKTFRARLSTASSPPNGTAFNSTAAASTTATTALTGRISNRDSASAQVVDPGALSGNGGNSTSTVATGTLNSANVSYVVFSAELGNTGDTVYLERYLVELVP